MHDATKCLYIEKACWLAATLLHYAPMLLPTLMLVKTWGHVERHVSLSDLRNGLTVA